MKTKTEPAEVVSRLLSIERGLEAVNTELMSVRRNGECNASTIQRIAAMDFVKACGLERPKRVLQLAPDHVLDLVEDEIGLEAMEKWCAHRREQEESPW